LIPAAIREKGKANRPRLASLRQSYAYARDDTGHTATGEELIRGHPRSAACLARALVGVIEFEPATPWLRNLQGLSQRFVSRFLVIVNALSLCGLSPNPKILNRQGAKKARRMAHSGENHWNL
jgi:hypothetical protein